jgi:GNAT superfamily N-acetyltransferase
MDESASCAVIWSDGEFLISTERSLLDFTVIHRFLTESYWSPGITRAAVEQATGHSMPFGVYQRVGSGRPCLIGFARVLTDFIRVAHLYDVFILDAHRGRGLSKRLIAAIIEHPQLRDVTVWNLGTRDAHGLYEQFGWERVQDPKRLMRRVVGTLPPALRD